MREIRYKKKLPLQKVKCINRYCFNYFTPVYPNPNDNLFCFECERKLAKESKELQKMIDNRYNCKKSTKNKKTIN